MTLYDKILSQLETGRTIDIVPLFPNESYQDLLNTCKDLKAEGFINLKYGGNIIAFGLDSGDSTVTKDTKKIECRLLRDTRTTHTTNIEKIINLKDSMYVGGDNSGNMAQSSNFSNTPITNNIQPATNSPDAKKSILFRTWTFISDNKIISGIILLIIGYLIKYLLTGNFGEQNNK